MIFNSIRWRLQVWHGLILLAVLAGFGYTAHRLQRANELRRVDQELQRRLGPLMEAMGRRPPGGPRGPGDPRPGPRDPDDGPRRRPPPGEARGEPRPPPRELRLGPGRETLFEEGPNAFYYVIWSRDGSELDRSATAPANVFLPEVVDGVGPAPLIRMRGTIRELYRVTPPGECHLVGCSIAPELANLRQLALWLCGLGGAVLVLGLAGGWWLATRAIRPIHEISAAAATIATGDLSRRIDAEETDNELGQLAGVLNSTFDRLAAAFERQQQFTADAAHELRTPIAVILSQAQATLARERNPTEYRETIEACQRAAQRMRGLTESLLVLARLDAGQETLRRECIDLGEVTRECTELLRPLAEERQVTIQCELARAECRGDAEGLSQVITNLVSNAILHNQGGTEVRVATRSGHGSAVLIVADSGPGIPAEDLPRVFERFYRADKARSGANGGSGLGLAISKAIVEVHGGTIEVASGADTGTMFSVRLPGAGGD